MNRRELLKATGVTALGATVAGCMGGDQGSGGGEPTDDGDDEVQEGGPDQDSWFNLTGEVANDTVEDLKFTSVNLAQIAGGDGNETADEGVFGTGNPVAAVNGTLKNTGDRAYEDVQVTATLYDQNDPIGQFFDSTEAQNKDYLLSGKEWRFTIVFKGADVDQATRYTVKADGDLVDPGAIDTDGDIFDEGVLEENNTTASGDNTTSGNATTGTATETATNGTDT